MTLREGCADDIRDDSNALCEDAQLVIRDVVQCWTGISTEYDLETGQIIRSEVTLKVMHVKKSADKSFIAI